MIALQLTTRYVGMGTVIANPTITPIQTTNVFIVAVPPIASVGKIATTIPYVWTGRVNVSLIIT